MVKKAHQNPSGGLNQAGRDHFKRTEGANLKRPQKKEQIVAVFHSLLGLQE